MDWILANRGHLFAGSDAGYCFGATTTIIIAMIFTATGAEQSSGDVRIIHPTRYDKISWDAQISLSVSGISIKTMTVGETVIRAYIPSTLMKSFQASSDRELHCAAMEYGVRSTVLLHLHDKPRSRLSKVQGSRFTNTQHQAQQKVKNPHRLPSSSSGTESLLSRGVSGPSRPPAGWRSTYRRFRSISVPACLRAGVPDAWHNSAHDGGTETKGNTKSSCQASASLHHRGV